MSGTADAPRVGVIFPPGYPLILALGFWLHAPLWVGPVIAALSRTGPGVVTRVVHYGDSPTTADLIESGEYSATCKPEDDAASIATPRTWPSLSAVFTLTA